MASLRLFLACLVMLATPLQGFAATSMLLCIGKPGYHHGSSKARSENNRLNELVEQGTPHHPGASFSAAGNHVDDAQAGSGGLTATGADVKPPAVKTSACSVCAACCHSVATAESFTLAPLLPGLQTDLLTRTPVVPSQPTVVPDKPPRA